MNADWFARDASALVDLLSPFWLLSLLALTLATWGALAGLELLLKVASRLGIAPEAVSRSVDLLRVAIVLAAIYIVASTVIGAAPILGGMLVMGCAAVVLVATIDRIRSLVVGMLPHWRREVRVGDHLALGEVSGVVRRFGLFRIELEAARGDRIHLPNLLLATGPVRVRRAREASVVSVTLADLPGANDVVIEAVRLAALLSPYRGAGAPVRIRALPEGVVVEIQAWSDAATRLAERHLAASARAGISTDATES